LALSANVIIPIFVIEEIDTFKKDQSELGRNARQVARLLDQHRSEGGLNQAQPMRSIPTYHGRGDDKNRLRQLFNPPQKGKRSDRNRGGRAHADSAQICSNSACASREAE